MCPVLKDHTNIMAVITQRARHIEIVRRLWHSKDAKTAVEQGCRYSFFSYLMGWGKSGIIYKGGGV